MATNFLCMPCYKIPNWLENNYLAIILILVVLVFSLVLPDISQKLHKNNELKAIKSVIMRMQEEVKRAEVACLTANEEMSNLHTALNDEATETTQESQNLSACTSRRLHTTQSDPCGVEKRLGYIGRFFGYSPNSSKKEITLMTVMYTDSFDSQEEIKDVGPEIMSNK